MQKWLKKNEEERMEKKRVEDRRGMVFTVKEEDMGWLEKCYVGYVNNPGAVYLLQDKLIDEGVSNFTITPMGGDLVLSGGKRF